jgi:hypothetical protein
MKFFSRLNVKQCHPKAIYLVLGVNTAHANNAGKLSLGESTTTHSVPLWRWDFIGWMNTWA